jgi:hypothetical protein
MIFYFVLKNYNNCANLPCMKAEKEKIGVKLKIY